MQYIPELVISLIAGTLGILIVLWIESQKRPSLSMRIGIPGTIDEHDALKRHPTTFLKVQIHNRNVPKWLSWVYDGEPALSCAGWITFHHRDGPKVFDREMLARWSETQDPPPIHATKTEEGVIARLVNPQNTIDIPPGEYANLDVVSRFDGEDACYGWNNESYMHNWKHPEWELDKGRYLAKIRVKTGGREFEDAFVVVNDIPFADFRLEEAPGEVKNRALG